MDPVVKPKRGRGRPKKINCNPILQPEVLLPTITEDKQDEGKEPRQMVLEEDTQCHGNTSFTEIVQLNGGIDLTDIAKKEPVEPKVDDANQYEDPEPDQSFRENDQEPPTTPMPFPSFSTVPAVAESESEEDRKTRRDVVAKLKKYSKEFPAVAAIPMDFDAPVHVLLNQLDEVRALIQNKTTGILIKRSYLTSVSALETIGKKKTLPN